MGRDDAWAAVWNDRDEERTDWNGCEAIFDSLTDYEGWVSHVADVVAEELALGPDDVVLDLGCGTGRYAAELAGRVRAITACDFSEPALAIARRDRRPANVTYRWADLNAFDPAMFAGATKAYAVGSVFYLTSVDHVMDLVQTLLDQGTDVMLLDLPDADLADTRERDYDRGLYSHLNFRMSDFTDRFPQARLVRGKFPEYVNDAVRFSVVIAATP